ncbi:16369_t:CDS:2 [Entrophospora sp. SA101]|nr:16369_t:CDS:2 [Entrophospora sp. SA101]
METNDLDLTRKSILEQRKRNLLYLLTFIFSRKDYECLSPSLSKILKSVGLKIPNNEEFKDASKSGLLAFLKVTAITIVIEILLNLSKNLKKKKSIFKLLDERQIKSSYRFAISVSSYIVIYKSLLRFFIRLLDPLLKPPTNPSINDVVCSPLVSPFLAGCLAGPCLLIDNDKPRRISLAIYTFTKSLQFLYHYLRKTHIIPKMSWWWGSWLIFPLSSAQLIYSYFRSSTYVQPIPEYFPKSISWPTGREIVDRIEILASLYYPKFYSSKLHGRDAPPLPDALKSVKVIFEIAHPAHTKMMCAMLHPEDPSCLRTFTKFIVKEGLTALKFMGVMHAVGLLFKSKSFLKRPNDIIKHILNSTIPATFKGATFITMAISTAWALICGFQQVLPNKFMPISRIFINGFIGGLWILVESPNRRLDIGMYSLRLSIESTWKLLLKKGKVRNIRNGEAIYFSLAMGCIMAIYKTQPKSISSYYRIIIKKLLNE